MDDFFGNQARFADSRDEASVPGSILSGRHDSFHVKCRELVKNGEVGFPLRRGDEPLEGLDVGPAEIERSPVLGLIPAPEVVDEVLERGEERHIKVFGRFL